MGKVTEALRLWRPQKYPADVEPVAASHFRGDWGSYGPSRVSWNPEGAPRSGFRSAQRLLEGRVLSHEIGRPVVHSSALLDTVVRVRAF